MYCKICGKRTTWDTSVGKASFIVCNPCFEERVESKQGNIREAYSEIMQRGRGGRATTSYQRFGRHWRSNGSQNDRSL